MSFTSCTSLCCLCPNKIHDFRYKVELLLSRVLLERLLKVNGIRRLACLSAFKIIAPYMSKKDNQIVSR